MASKGDINKHEIQPPYPSRWLLVSYDEILEKTKIDVKLKSKDLNSNGIYPVIDQGTRLISGYIDNKDLLYSGSLPVVIFGDHTRNIKYVDFKFAVGADGTKILKPKKGINERFLYYNLQSLRLPDFGYSRHFSVFKALDFPLPPLPEQERIVVKLDKLFAQHEKIKKALDRIPQLLKAFRQQVLTQAVTGKLTEQWREGKELEEWRTCELNSVLKEKGIFDGPFGSNLKTEDYTESGVRVVRLENIEQLVFLNNKKTYISLGKYELLKKHEVFEGDIIFSSFIADKIRACILPYTGEKMIAKADCFCLRPNYSLIEGQYMIYLLVSPPTFGDLARETRGATRPRINTTILKKLIISLPSLKEQQEIVRRVESLFAKADAIESRYQTLKGKIDNLPQAILHKAFRGELVPQLSNDGDARDLLKEIMALKNGVNGKKKKTT